MRMSLVIGSHNEGQNLGRTLASCREVMAGFDYEMVVADDASTDDSLAALADFPEVRLFRQPRRLGPSPTKDVAARNATGDVLVFLDGHCKPEPGSIQRLIGDVEATGGRAVVTPAIPSLDVATWENMHHVKGNGYWLALETLDYGWLGLDRLRRAAEHPDLFESPCMTGCAFAVTRELYERLLGFDPDMRSWGVEDLDFGLKAWLMGTPILHDPEAVIGHRFQARFTTYDVTCEHVLANQLRMARKNLGDVTWGDWFERARARHEPNLWAGGLALFEVFRPSIEAERDHLLARRSRDEHWYARRFDLAWPPDDPAATPNSLSIIANA